MVNCAHAVCYIFVGTFRIHRGLAAIVGRIRADSAIICTNRARFFRRLADVITAGAIWAVIGTCQAIFTFISFTEVISTHCWTFTTISRAEFTCFLTVFAFPVSTNRRTSPTILRAVFAILNAFSAWAITANGSRTIFWTGDVRLISVTESIVANNTVRRACQIGLITVAEGIATYNAILWTTLICFVSVACAITAGNASTAILAAGCAIFVKFTVIIATHRGAHAAVLFTTFAILCTWAAGSISTFCLASCAILRARTAVFSSVTYVIPTENRRLAVSRAVFIGFLTVAEKVATKWFADCAIFRASLTVFLFVTGRIAAK